MHRTALFAAVSLAAASGAGLAVFATGRGAGQESPAGAITRGRLVPPQATPLPAQATWVLRSDTKLNGQVEAPAQTDRLALKARGDALTGGYVEQLAQGKDNRSRFSGEVIRAPAGGAVRTLRQEDRWYVACYAGRRTGENRFAGSWFDSDGRTGDFELGVAPE